MWEIDLHRDYRGHREKNWEMEPQITRTHAIKDYSHFRVHPRHARSPFFFLTFFSVPSVSSVLSAPNHLTRQPTHDQRSKQLARVAKCLSLIRVVTARVITLHAGTRSVFGRSAAA